MSKHVTKNVASLFPQALIALGLTVMSGVVLAAPPATRVEPVTDMVHGVEIRDNYRWLEGDNSNPQQMGKVTEEVGAWTDAQNAYTRSILDNLPRRKEVEDSLRPLMEIGSVSAPSMKGHRYFYTKREGKENQPRLLMRESHDGAPRVLVDPAKIDPSGLTALSGMVPSHDGSLLAFGTYKAGDENTTTYIMDVTSGTWMADVIPGKSSLIQWMPDNSGFFYERLENVKDPYSAQIKFHRMGTYEGHDPVLFRQYTKEQNEKLATTWGPGAIIDKNCRWMVLTYWTGTASMDMWAVDLKKWRETGKFERVDMKVGANATFGGEIDGDTFYMLTDYNAPNKAVYAVNMNHPEESAWKTLIPERQDAVLTGFGLLKGGIVGDYEEKASTRLRLFAMDGKPKGDVKLPGIGSAGLSTEDDRTEAYLSFTSFNFPSTIFRMDLANPTAEPVVWERPDVPVDPSMVEVKQVSYPSKDGTPVTMFIVHRKGLKLDGTNPTILNAYGGFNISMTPNFNPTLFPWLEAGGVFALPNLRGGGEYGKAWHEGGMHEHKQNVFDDMIAAAEWLIANKYTSTSKLATTGGSNGGLLMGAMMTQRPDLFSCVVCQVPLLDMVRYQNFLMARYWTGEYGSVDDKDKGAEMFGYIRKYSPYHNIKEGVKYPGIMFTAGENDTRVHPLHARKMAAAMQAVVASQPGARPVIVWVDREAGHGQGKPLNLRIRDAADIRMFIMWQLGMLETKQNEFPPVKASAASDASGAGSQAQGRPSAFGAPTKVAAIGQLTLRVEGMKCEMCVAKVTNTLKGIKGVHDASVSLDDKRATVVVEQGASVSEAAIKEAFKGSEFKIEISE